MLASQNKHFDKIKSKSISPNKQDFENQNRPTRMRVAKQTQQDGLPNFSDEEMSHSEASYEQGTQIKRKSQISVKSVKSKPETQDSLDE